MPVLERRPDSTTQVVAGWQNPSNAYAYNDSYTYSETSTAEQTYGYRDFLHGNEVLDKVFIRLEYIVKQTTVATGDDAACTFTVKVYNGSTWTSYQVTKYVYNCTTVNGESFTCTDGDASNNTVAIDVTSLINTLTKLNSIQTRLLTTITADAGITMRVSVDCVSVLVCYHIQGNLYPQGQATTKRDVDKPEYKAIKQVAQALSSTS